MATGRSTLACLVMPVVAACAGGGATGPDRASDGVEVGGLRVAARASGVLGPVLVVRVEIRNVTRHAVLVGLERECLFRLRLFRSADRAGPAAWDSERLVRCPRSITPASLAPGESVWSEMQLPVASILGDSLPPGAYHPLASGRLHLPSASSPVTFDLPLEAVLLLRPSSLDRSVSS